MAKAIPAQINQVPTLQRQAQRLKRVKLAIDQLTEQLKTPFRYKESEEAAKIKLKKLEAEHASVMAQLKAAKAELDELIGG